MIRDPCWESEEGITAPTPHTDSDTERQAREHRGNGKHKNHRENARARPWP